MRTYFGYKREAKWFRCLVYIILCLLAYTAAKRIQHHFEERNKATANVLNAANVAARGYHY